MKILLGALMALAFAHDLYAQDSVHWKGEYYYVANYGRNAGGTAMVVSYGLQVNGEGESPNAVLTGEGYQTDDTIYCNCIFKHDSTFFLFRSYPDGGVINRYGVKEYSPNQLLFTLVCTSHRQKGAKKIKTIWGAFNSDDTKKNAFRELAK